MANEIYHSSGGLSDLRVAAVLATEVQRLIADMFSLWNHPAFPLVGDVAGTNSNVIDQPQAGLDGYDIMASVAENASSSNTGLTDASPSVTVSRQSIQRQLSDLYRLTGTGNLDIDRLAVDTVFAASMRGTELICNVGDDFTTSKGTTTVDMNSDDWFDAQFALTQAGVAAALAVLYPVQVTDLISSLRGESGPIQFVDDTQAMLNQMGEGYQGRLNGIPIFASSHVPTANGGADSAGFMAAAGAIGRGIGTPKPIRGAGEVILPAGSLIQCELERDAAGGLTKLVGNAWMGVAILLDGAGVSIITDR